MKQVCVDANLVVTWLTPEEGRDQAVAFLDQCLGQGIGIIAPDCVFAEVGSALRRKVYRGIMDDEDGRVALSLLDRFAIDVVPVLSLYAEAWKIAVDYNLSTLYDAYYMALAKLHECDFWTADQRFLNSVPNLPYVRSIRDFGPGILES
jgi:predicted nucleic acid-binding protein